MNRLQPPTSECAVISHAACVLDPCCGTRAFWFDKTDERVVFGDIRHETVRVTDRSGGKENGSRVLKIESDSPMDFRALPFTDKSFALVVFDPPHLLNVGKTSWLYAKYGCLGKHWRDDLRRGFAECFRVLKTDGVLIFKWAETQIKVSEILTLTEMQPLFGHQSGKRSGTHWLVFIKAAFKKRTLKHNNVLSKRCPHTMDMFDNEEIEP